MVAIKSWYLDKKEIKGFYNKELKIEKETNKAVLVGCFINGRKYTEWVPKSCLTDEWEKDTSNFGYHDYLVGVYRKAYENGMFGEIKVIRTGRNRNVYRGDAFIHQCTTKELTKKLSDRNVEFMNRKEWNER